jgi:hypothetical protein
MPGDRITLATVPDRATAELLGEVLRDGGIESVELEAIPGNPYLGRAHALEHEVRVADVDEANARKVLADFEESSGQAAISQAAIPPEPHETRDDDSSVRKRKPWVIWGFAALVFAMFGAPLIAILRSVLHDWFGR